MNDIYIRIMPNMPSRVRGFVQEDEAGNYTIFINEALSPEARDKAVRHELGHIRKNHLQQKQRKVKFLEKEVILMSDNLCTCHPE